ALDRADDLKDAEAVAAAHAAGGWVKPPRLQRAEGDFDAASAAARSKPSRWSKLRRIAGGEREDRP
ncbi:MAG: hypothetical protein ABSF27_09670, partial [Candidatus Dormibacteria bacterium]